MKQPFPDDFGRLVRRKLPTKVLSVVSSIAILYLLYRNLNREGIWRIVASANVPWLVVSVGLIVPITLLSALRFRWVITTKPNLGLVDATALTLVSGALNLFLPAKLGDLAKSHFLYHQRYASAGVALSVVVYERLCDVFAIATWCLLGWLSGLAAVDINMAVLPALLLWLFCGAMLASGSIARGVLAWASQFRFFQSRSRLTRLMSGWPELHAELGSRSLGLVLFSVGIWFLHLTQIWLFTRAVNAHVAFTANLAIAPIVLLCGLVPFTLGGIGPRDAAVIYLYSAYMPPELAAAVGLLTISRSLVPAVAALPFLPRYFQAAGKGSLARENIPDAP